VTNVGTGDAQGVTVWDNFPAYVGSGIATGDYVSGAVATANGADL